MPTNELRDFPERLIGLRRQAGISQRELGRRVALKSWSLSYYESGEKEPTLPVLYALREALDCTWTELLGPDPLR